MRTDAKERISTFTYKIDDLTFDLLSKRLQSRYISEYHYGFEYLNTMEEQYATMIVPVVDRVDYPLGKIPTFLDRVGEDGVVYDLYLKHAPYLPLYLESVELLSHLQDIPLYSQVFIKKKVGYHRNRWIDQYVEYLKGNDYPSESKVIRGIQSKIIAVLSRIGNFNDKRDDVPEIEDKICSQHYYFQMRIAVLDRQYVDEFEKRVSVLLKKMAFHNEWQLEKVDITLSDLMKYDVYFNQSNILSEQEILALLSHKSQSVATVTPKVEQTDSNELLPLPANRNHMVDNDMVNKLIDSFKRTRITTRKVKVESVNRGATLQKVSLAIPHDVVYTQIEKNLKNIQATLGNDSVSVEIGDVADTVDFYIPCENRDPVYLRSIVENDDFREHLRNSHIPLIIGEDSIGSPLFSCLSELKHILIAGSTGSGKSVYLNSIILTMLMYKDPGELQLILVDPKQVELNQFEDFPHVTFVSDMDKAGRVFHSLLDEMERRYELFAQSKCKNIQQYNRKAANPIPYTVCVVDELSDLMVTHGADIESSIVRLGQKARASGIHLILCTQKPSADVITSRIKSNLPSAISFRLKAQSDYKTVFGKGIPYHLLGKGDGVAMIEGERKEFVRFQAPVITLDENEEKMIIERLLKKHKDVECDQFELSSPIEPIDKLKCIVASTGETRVAELQKAMQIRMANVSELMKQLVAEGWLVKEGKSYKLIASEDELNKWVEAAEK